MMTYEEFRESMESFRRSADLDAASQKDSQLTLDQLHRLYARFDELERALANRVLAEWSLSHGEGRRFDALAIIDEYSVTDTLPALRELAGRLSSSGERGAPYELQKVIRVLDHLAQGGQNTTK
jgi:hypothetical protein